MQAFLARPDFHFTFDGLHGVSGPYAKRIFGQVWSPLVPRLQHSAGSAIAPVTVNVLAMFAGVGCSSSDIDELRPSGGTEIRLMHAWSDSSSELLLDCCHS
jgi:hypothetical protein